MLLSGLRVAVDGQTLAADASAVRTGQEHHQRCNVGRVDESLDRLVRQGLCGNLFQRSAARISTALQNPVYPIAGDGARVNDVGGDAKVAKVRPKPTSAHLVDE